MLTEKVKSSLCEKLASVVRGNKDLSEEALISMIEVFDHSLEIEPMSDVELVPTLLNNAFEKFIDGGIEKSVECVKDINLIEQYSKHIMSIANPDLLATKPKREWDKKGPGTSWQLADVYKEGLRLIDAGTNLSSEGNKIIKALEINPNTAISYPDGFYFIAYAARNEEAHAAIKRDVFLAYRVVLSIIMSYLLLADRYSTVIESQFEYLKIKKSISIDDYLNALLKEKKSKIQRYVPLSWKKYSKENDELFLPDKIGKLTKKQLKIVGPAGSGKTFLMEKIECLLAQRHLESGSLSDLIPVYLKLIDILRQESNSIEALFAERTGLPIEDADSFMCNKSIILLLDGYDEISDIALKRAVAVKIDNLVLSNANIIVTDREVNSRVQLSDKLSCFIPQNMSKSDYRQLIEMYAQKSEVKKMLLDKLDSNLEYYDDYNTPLKLVNLIEVSDFNGAVMEGGNNLTDTYIQYLFDREAQQKKNPLTKPLQRLLAGLALDSALDGVDSFSEAKVLSIFSKWKSTLGYDCDTDACLTLATQLGILILDQSDSNVKYRFYNDEFYVSFSDMAEKFGLIDLI